jgi:serine/threonine protein kinase
MDCISGPNLYYQMKSRTFPLREITMVGKQLCEYLQGLASTPEKYSHGDLKLENLQWEKHQNLLTVLDLNSAYQGEQSGNMIRTYKSRPIEEFLAIPHGLESDVWSVGCILAEMYIQDELFKNLLEWETLFSNVYMINMILNRLGCDSIPDDLLAKTNPELIPLYFTTNTSTGKQELIKLEESFFEGHPKKKEILKQLNQPLESLIEKAPSHDDFTDEDKRLFIDLIRSMLKIDPKERITPQQALEHPFFNGKNADVPFSIEIVQTSQDPVFKGQHINLFFEEAIISEDKKRERNLVFSCKSYSRFLGKCLHLPQTHENRYILRISNEAGQMIFFGDFQILPNSIVKIYMKNSFINHLEVIPKG